jgi:hypothetical protein
MPDKAGKRSIFALASFGGLAVHGSMATIQAGKRQVLQGKKAGFFSLRRLI